MLVAAKDGAVSMVQADLPQENSSVDQKRMREDLEGNHMVSVWLQLSHHSSKQSCRCRCCYKFVTAPQQSLSRCSALLVQPLCIHHAVHASPLPHLMLVQGNGVSEGDAEEEMAYTDDVSAEPTAANGHGREGDFTERAQYIPLRLQVRGTPAMCPVICCLMTQPA